MLPLVLLRGLHYYHLAKTHNTNTMYIFIASLNPHVDCVPSCAEYSVTVNVLPTPSMKCFHFCYASDYLIQKCISCIILCILLDVEITHNGIQTSSLNWKIVHGRW
jgi:hypothetical protein